MAQDRDELLIEQLDRIRRLNSKDEEIPKSTNSAKGSTTVSLDLSSSHQGMLEAVTNTASIAKLRSAQDGQGQIAS